MQIVYGDGDFSFFKGTQAWNHAKCDSWVKSLHIFFFFFMFCLICRIKQELRSVFHITLVLKRCKINKQCTVDFKIKGDNSVNVTQIQRVIKGTKATSAIKRMQSRDKDQTYTTKNIK